MQGLFAHQAHAWRPNPDLIYGGFIGFGGSGIEKTVVVNSADHDISRSESPGMIGLSVEGFVADRWSLALSHRRGFRLGPFSSGVNFTGLIMRRYFYHSPPIIPNKNLTTSITVQTWAPFIGLGTGLAHASTNRDSDVVSNVSSSAIYLGLHVGFDYQINPKLILRPEIFTSASFMDVSETPSTIEEFGIVCGFHFKL